MASKDKSGADAPKVEAQEEVSSQDEGQPKAAPTELEVAIARGVDAFVAGYLRNSPFSQDTPAWNHFQAGIPVLIGNIAKELEG